jgi:hypothetical protein
VALLLTSDPNDALREVDPDERAAPDGAGPIGHLALLRWLGR